MIDSISTRLDGDVSLAVVSFGDELKTGAMSTADFLDAAVRLGFRSVELCDRTVREPAAIMRLLSERDLYLPSIALRNDFTGSHESMIESCAHLKRWISMAAEFGCRTARIWSGWQRSDGSARRQVVAALDDVMAHATKAQVALALETHGGLSNDPGFLAELCERYPRETFGVCVDFGNLPAAERRLSIATLAPLATHVHVKSHEFDALGIETTIPLIWAIETIARAGSPASGSSSTRGPHHSSRASGTRWQRCTLPSTASRSRNEQPRAARDDRRGSCRARTDGRPHGRATRGRGHGRSVESRANG